MLQTIMCSPKQELMGQDWVKGFGNVDGKEEMEINFQGNSVKGAMHKNWTAPGFGVL